jgi:hypothetical protein
VKDLALLNPDDRFSAKTVCDWNKHKLRMVDDDTSLHSMLEEFKAVRGGHMIDERVDEDSIL